MRARATSTSRSTTPSPACPNRALFADRVEQALSEARRSGRDVCVAIVDLDRFKEVNDTLGHANGDKFLFHISHHLQEALRPGDTVARLGGDEFGLVLPHVEERDVTAVLQRVNEAVGVEIELAGIPVGAEASIGWTMYPEDSDDARTLLQYADVAMYAAKTGRIDLIRYDPELDRFDPSRLGLVSDLRRAIGADELELHYQPKIEIATGLVDVVRGAHALEPPDARPARAGGVPAHRRVDRSDRAPHQLGGRRGDRADRALGRPSTRRCISR